jgi:hypothetical protein
MPSWKAILDEITALSPDAGAVDLVRRKYVAELARYTGRNVIVYYSGWLSKPALNGIAICDDDKNGFMNAVHGLDRSLGLDLILHTPGGDIAATESLVHYLRKLFGTDIRAIVPQIAMSAGTMIACSCREIIMGKQSNLGPIDPQLNGVPAQAVIDEFEEAIREVAINPAAIPIWQAIIGKYHPTFIGECKRAIVMSKDIVAQWLITGMYNDGKPDPEKRAENVVSRLSDHEDTKMHSRHIHIDDCESMGLKVSELESDPRLQDLVLSVHHACIHTMSMSAAYKFIENQAGGAYFKIHA